jgi:hypothetical protein
MSQERNFRRREANLSEPTLLQVEIRFGTEIAAVERISQELVRDFARGMTLWGSPVLYYETPLSNAANNVMGRDIDISSIDISSIES